jgi:ADP-ribose diphosphatase
MPKTKPEILEINNVAKTKLFNIEQVNLKFSNGELRTFERLRAGLRKAVIIAAMQDKETILLVNEYAVGTERYELGLPKGLVEVNETLEEAANRELQEEIGMKAKNLQYISTLALAPNYMAHLTDLIIATDLTASKLIGDEPEPLEVVPYNINEIDDLILSGKIIEARSIASLFIVKKYLLKSNVL